MPPIDPSIILNARTPAPVATSDPMDRYAKVLGMQAAMGQQDVQALQLQQLRQGVADDQATREAFTAAGGDRSKALEALYGRGLYKPAQALEKSILEQKKTDSEIGKNTAQGNKAAWEVQKDKLQQGAAMLDLARDPQSFASVLRLGQMNGVFTPEAVAQMSAQGYSPQLVETLKAAGLTRAQQLEEQNRVAVRAETGRHNRATEANTVRGQNLTAATTREGHAVTRRGQDLTNARALEANDPTKVAQRAEATARGKEIGESQAQAQIMLPTVISRAERAISLIDDMVGSEDGKKKPHAGFSKAVGTALPLIDGLTATPGQRFIPGTDAADFQARFDELKGGQFLEAFESLKGGGAITQIEGEKATQAISRMSLAQSEKEYKTAAREFQGIVRRGIERAKAKAGQRPATDINPANLSNDELLRELNRGG